MHWPTVIVIGRILADSGSPPPSSVEDRALLFIKRTNVVVDCPLPVDAGVDAGVDSGIDAGPADAGVDAGPSDAGPSDASVPDASTACITWPDAVTMFLHPRVSVGSDGTRFAILLVTPDRPVFELTSPLFAELERVSAPRVITTTRYVEDPTLGEQCDDGCENESSSGGCEGEDWSWDPPPVGDAGLGSGSGSGGPIEEIVGPYQFFRAKPRDRAELASWLDQLGYDYMPQDLDAVAPYVALGNHVVALRVTIEGAMSTSLPPIALTWPGTAMRIPAALGGFPGMSPTTLSVYVSADGKYLFPGAKLRFAQYTGNTTFLTRMDVTIDQTGTPAQDPIASRSTDDKPFQEVIEKFREVRVPVEVPCEDGCEGGGCCSDCNARPRARVDLGLIVVAVAFVLRRRRRR